jgi:hypothetical protein
VACISAPEQGWMLCLLCDSPVAMLPPERGRGGTRPYHVKLGRAAAMDHRVETAIGSPARHTPQACRVFTCLDHGWRWDLAAALAFFGLILAACSGALLNAFELGADEHYEVTKAFLWSKGFRLYQDIWNDQQPLLTILQGVLFKCFGVHVMVARCLAVSFGALLTAGLFHLVRKSFGLLAASAAIICLLTAPQVFGLTISPMLEVPAFGVGLWALWAIRRWEHDCRGSWLVASGLILATALQIKLTAVLLAPALGIELVIITLSRAGPGRFRETVRNSFIWGGAVLGGFVLLGLVLGSGYRQAFASHFSTPTPEALAEINQLGLSLADFVRHPEALWGLGAALGVAAWKRSWRQLAFPLALFVTAAAVHLNHRPYWPYYYLHFAVPIAWLTGYAVGELWKAAFQAVRSAPRLTFRGIALALAASFLGAVVVAGGGARLASDIEQIRAIPHAARDPIVARMKSLAPRTRWVYTRATMYAFHAKLPVIPELAVMPRKRVWSGQITRVEVVTLLKKYQPEQLLLSDEELADAQLRSFVTSGYTLLTQEAGLSLFAAKGL